MNAKTKNMLMVFGLGIASTVAANLISSRLNTAKVAAAITPTGSTSKQSDNSETLLADVQIPRPIMRPASGGIVTT